MSNELARNAALNHPMMHALLEELAAKLRLLVESAEPQQIDLRRLPLPEDARAALGEWLGSGEIEATVRALAVTTIRETAIAGVWWVRLAKLTGETIDEHLEITRCPALLMAHSDDVARAACALEERLAALRVNTGRETQ